MGFSTWKTRLLRHPLRVMVRTEMQVGPCSGVLHELGAQAMMTTVPCPRKHVCGRSVGPQLGLAVASGRGHVLTSSKDRSQRRTLPSHTRCPRLPRTLLPGEAWLVAST